MHNVMFYMYKNYTTSTDDGYSTPEREYVITYMELSYKHNPISTGTLIYNSVSPTSIISGIITHFDLINYTINTGELTALISPMSEYEE